MSFAIHYTAIPPTSTFYKRLHTERPLATLVATFFPEGNGIYRFFEVDINEINDLNESLDEVIKQHQDIFGTDLEADMWIAEFRDELRRTRKNYPGIADRRAMLEKCASEIEERLLQEITKKQDENVNLTVRTMIFDGERDFIPDSLPEGELKLVTLPLVQQGAEFLRDIDSSTLFTEAEDWDRWYRDQFDWWKSLYLMAAEKEEELIVMIH